MIRYCLPLIAERWRTSLNEIRTRIDQYAFFEIWLDYLRDLGLDKADTVAAGFAPIAAIIKELPDRIVLLLRRQELAPALLPLECRYAVLRAAAELPCFLDLDVLTQSDELEFLTKGQRSIKTILSFHDYQGTPSRPRLEEIVERMESRHATVVKIATMCRSQQDALRLLELTLLLQEKGLQFIVLGMGEPGKIVRVVSTLWGNFMTFAPHSAAKASAPGQLTRTQMQRIFRDLSD